MKKIFVKKTFDWRVTSNFYQVHSAGYEIEVSEECAAFATTAGFADYSDIAEDNLIEGDDR